MILLVPWIDDVGNFNQIYDKCLERLFRAVVLLVQEAVCCNVVRIAEKMENTFTIFFIVDFIIT